jgi:hypothetical protein
MGVGDVLEEDIYGYGKNLPAGPILLLTRYLDKIPIISESWRGYFPSFMTSPPIGILSHRIPDIDFPPLKPYSDCDDIVSFLSSTNTTLGDLTSVSAVVTVFLLVVFIRFLKGRIMLPYFRNWGRHFATETHGSLWVKENPERIEKFGEYCFRLIFHGSISVYGLCYFADKAWWDPGRGGTLNLYLNHPHHPIEPGMAWYYLIQAAYNLETVVYMLEFSVAVKWSPYPHLGWKSTARGDFREMMLHHFATMGLIYLSSYYRFTRVGSMVFLVHDVSDVPVDLSKLANFVKWKKTTIVCFVIMVIMWFISRLCIYTFIIFRSMLFETQILMWEWVPPEYFFAHRFLVIGLSGIILLLNFVWFGMFLKMGWVLVSQGKTHDLTEHKQGEVVKAGCKVDTNGCGIKKANSKLD